MSPAQTNGQLQNAVPKHEFLAGRISLDFCNTLSRMPGVEFPGHDPLDWFKRPSRFTFRGELYEVSIPYDNIRVCPVDLGKPVIEMEELLEYVRHNVLKQKVARYTIR